MKDIKYSCCGKPDDYTLLHTDREYPMPVDGVYYWHISNFTPDMDKFRVILAFEKVMQIWQRALDTIPPLGQFISIKSTEDITKAHFVFSFGSGFHDFMASNGVNSCPFPFDGVQGVLAHAWSLESSYPFGGQLHLDESEKWSKMHGFQGATFNTHLLTVILHEMGHVWGIGHSQVREAVMFPSYTGIKDSLHSDDLAGLAKKMSPIKQKVMEQSPEVPGIEEPGDGCGPVVAALLMMLYWVF